MKKGDKRLLIILVLIVIVGAAITLLPMGEIQPKADSAEATEQKAETADEEATIEETTLINVDDNAPDFTVEMSDGSTVSMSELRGQVVLVTFFATTCPPCLNELQRVQTAIIDPFCNRGLKFLPISRGEDKATVEAFLKKNGYTFPVGIDTDGSTYNKFATKYIPRNFLINRQGVVVEASVGYDTEEFDALCKLINMTLMAR